MRRGAYTLTEVMIAMAILAVVMAATLQMVIASRGHEASASAQDDLAEDAERCLRLIGEDITISGWHIPDGTTSVAAETALDGSGHLSSDIAIDRTKRYYPYVIGHASGSDLNGNVVAQSNPLQFPHAELDASLLIDLPRLATSISATAAPVADLAGLGAASASAAAWYGSYAKPSQSLIFLRAFTYDGQGELDQTLPPAQVKTRYESYLKSGGPVLRFGRNDDSDLNLWKTSGNHATLGIAWPSGIYETSTGAWLLRPGVIATSAYGVPLESGYVVTATDGSLRVQPQWETIDPPTHQRPANEDVWREYVYTVVRSPRGNRLGRLVRAHTELIGTPLPARGVEVGQAISANANASGDPVLIIDRVLSDNVVRVAFDTYRTDRFFGADSGRLDVNQVRVRLYLARPDQVSGTVITRVVGMIFTMRAKNTEAQRADDLLLLGPDRPGFPR